MRTKRIVNITAVFIIAFAVITAVFQMTRPASAADEPVEVWLTLADESKLLNQEAGLQFQAGAGVAPQIITIDESQLYQQFEGAGAAMTDSSAWLIMNAISETERNALMADLFTGSGDGINLSYVRVPMGASDFALSSYTYNDMPAGQTDPTLANFSIAHDEAYIIPALQQARALNPQLRFMGTPWSAPAWMKDNGHLNGGSLQAQYYDAFADYHVKFAEAYAAHGLPIDTLTPQNEPEHETPNYPSMGMTAAEQKVFVRDNLGPALADANLQTRLLLLDHNWNLINYPLSILADPAAYAYADGTAFHCYSGDVANQSLMHQAYPDKGVWFTECSGGGWATDFGDNMTWNMQNLVVGNFRNYGKSLLLWNLALDENDGPQNGGCDNCRGVVTINQATKAIDYNVEYYVLGHVTKFVDPGAYRIDSTEFIATGPENVAFHNPDGSLVLIVHAAEAATFDVAWQGQHFSYSLPAQGTVTFKWEGGSVPAADNVLQGFEAEGTYFDVYQTTPTLSNTARFGTYSLQVVGPGNWHTVGAKLNNSPVDASGFSEICFWVLDTGHNNEGIAFKLVDVSTASKEIWSTDLPTPLRTVQNEWVQMCFDVSAFTGIDLSAIDHVELTTYWGDPYLYDQITYTIPEVEIEKTVALSNNPVQPGDVVTYTVSVINAGTAVAENVHITDTLPAYVTGVNLDVTETISAGESISFTIPATVALNAPWDTTITNSAHFSYTGNSGSASASFVVAALPLGMLQEFETEGSFYDVWNATNSLSDNAYGGLKSLQMTGSGEWHTVGAYLYNHPIDATIYDQLCFQVQDSGGSGNTIGLKLVDGTDAKQEIWSNVFGNPTTVLNEWVEMCFDVSAYDQVDLTNLDSVQLTTFWGDPYYFDNIRGMLPQLSLSKTVAAPSPAEPGDDVVYTITVSNTGTAVAENVHITDTLPAELVGVDIDEMRDIGVGETAVITIPATIADNAKGVTITNTAYYSHTSGQSSDGVSFTTAFAPPNVIQDFELPGFTYEVWNAAVGVTDTIVHDGNQAMFMVGEGEWHTGGANAYSSPRNLTAYNSICFWVYDASVSDSDNNTLALKLVDHTGANQETWSDWSDHSNNPNTKTTKDTWVEMCFSLAAYDLVDQTQIDSVQFTAYWGGTFYFDDIVVENRYMTYMPIIMK
ncbi:MAG: glycoside hydrolase family 30 beta sandwich domain-containing protein [Chloroflexota bacterium]